MLSTRNIARLFLASQPRTACIVAAGKVDGHYVLLKNRDRNYQPEIQIVHEVLDGLEVAYLIDDVTGWVEGLNEYGIGIVNAALMVSRDESERDEVERTGVKLKDGERILHALHEKTVASAANSIRTFRNGLKGHTIVSDGTKAVYVEMPDSNDVDYDDVPTDKWFVRTNHGVTYPDAGYVDGIREKSSVNRQEQAEDVLAKVTEVTDVAPLLLLARKDRWDPSEMVRDDKSNRKMRTTSQMVLDLSTKTLYLYLLPGRAKWKGITNNLPKGHEAKITVKVLEYKDLSTDTDGEVKTVKTATGLLPIMDPAFNVREIFKQLVLLEDHMFQPRKQCTDCIWKHMLAAEALAEEAVTLDVQGSKAELLCTLAEQIRGLQRQVQQGQPFGVIAQSVRVIRKRLLGVASSVRVGSTIHHGSYFDIDDVILYGKYKNKHGRIVKFFKDDRGVPMIEIEPIPKGRKQTKTLSLFNIWHADMTKRIAATWLQAATMQVLELTDEQITGLDSMLGYNYVDSKTRQEEKIIKQVLQRIPPNSNTVSVTPKEAEVLHRWEADGRTASHRTAAVSIEKQVIAYFASLGIGSKVVSSGIEVDMMDVVEQINASDMTENRASLLDLLRWRFKTQLFNWVSDSVVQIHTKSDVFSPRVDLVGDIRYKVKSTSNEILVRLYDKNKAVGWQNAFWKQQAKSCADDVAELRDRFPQVGSNILIVDHSFLDESYHGKGIGRAMYQAMMSEAFKRKGPFLFTMSACSIGSGTSSQAVQVWHSLYRQYPSVGNVIAVLQAPKVGARDLMRQAAKYKDKKKIKTQDGDEATVYVYSDRQIQNRNREKAERVENLRHQMSDLRSQVQKDIDAKDPKKRLTALAVALIDATFERVGNEDSADEGHFGVTGWLKKHLTFSKGKATVKYVGKSGVSHEKVIEDSKLVAALKGCCGDKKPDDAILSFGKDDKEGSVKITSRDVNEYLKPFDVTAKDLRGFHANREMQDQLRALRNKGPTLPKGRKDKDKILKAEFKKALEATAEAVGHEAATLRTQYLVPGLEDAYLKDGTVIDNLKDASVEIDATKDDYEKETEQIENFSKPNPKKKPPRHDSRKHLVDTEEKEERDPDLSLNYKDTGG